MRRITMTDNMTSIDKKCIEKGISPKGLSIQSGVPTRTLEGWANRTRTNPNVYQLFKVAKVLGCHIEDLIEPDLEQVASK